MYLNDSDGDNNGEKDERGRSALHCEANGDNQENRVLYACI